MSHVNPKGTCAQENRQDESLRKFICSLQRLHLDLPPHRYGKPQQKNVGSSNAGDSLSLRRLVQDSTFSGQQWAQNEKWTKARNRRVRYLEKRHDSQFECAGRTVSDLEILRFYIFIGANVDSCLGKLNDPNQFPILIKHQMFARVSAFSICLYFSSLYFVSPQNCFYNSVRNE